MLDIRKLFFEESDVVKANLARRGFDFDEQQFVKLFEEKRLALSDLESLSAKRNAQAKAFQDAKCRGETEPLLIKKFDLEPAKERLARAQQALDHFVAQLPNCVDVDVPDGEGAQDNLIIKVWGEGITHDDHRKDHVALTEGKPFGSIDFQSASVLSGSRFSFLTGTIAQLHRALSNFMLDFQVDQHGYLEVVCPYLVKGQSLYGTGQLPKFLSDLFPVASTVPQTLLEALYLIPTGEVPLVNLLKGIRMPPEAFPLKWVTRTACFRSEAGAYGKDTRGLIRQHQFEKVELVQAVLADQADQALEEITTHAEAVLEALELPYRRVLLCAKDLGFTATKTYDLEVWIPSQGLYREISSCSNCGAFQARRLDAKVKFPPIKPGSKSATEWINTLNGSGLAVGRTLVAILENHQTSCGNVRIPKALQPYLKGQALLPVNGTLPE